MFLSFWLRSDFGRSGHSRPAPKHQRLTLEALGDRSLPSFTPSSLPVDGTAVGSAVGDFNKDGRDDIAVISTPLDFGSDRLTVCLGQTNGSFIPVGPIGGYIIGSHTGDPEVGDFNKDGKLDLVMLGSGGASVRVMLGNGDGTLSTQLYSTSVGQSYSLAAADLNGDGRSDVVLGHQGGVTVLPAKKGGGSALFGTPRSYQTTAWYTTAVAASDVTGDGKPDILAIDDAGGNDLAATSHLAVLRGNGDGTFAFVGSTDLGTKYVNDLSPVDFNRDGKRDVAVVNGQDLIVLPGNGNATFGTPTSYPYVFADSVAAGDFNRDGNPDLAINSGGNSVSVLLGTGDGSFASPQAIGGGVYGRVRVGNFNSDRYPDLVAGGEAFLNAADWGTQLATRFEISGPSSGVVQAGQPFSLAITVYDQDGNSMGYFTGTIHFTSSDGRATLPADYTFTTDGSGTFVIDSVVLRTKKRQAITISLMTDDLVTGTTYLFVS